MKNNLFHSIYNHPALRKEDLREIIAAHEKIDFPKGEVFLESGKMANAYYLIESGLLRAFVHDFNGNEITTAFHCPGEISIEVSSLFQRIPTEENIVALTDGTAWKIEFDIFEALFHKIEGFREWGRAWMAQQLFVSKKRSIDMLTRSAADRYLSLLSDHPEIIKDAPLKHIASWLGVTDTSLSRIRKEILTA